jgi:hypothetical protein
MARFRDDLDNRAELVSTIGEKLRGYRKFKPVLVLSMKVS